MARKGSRQATWVQGPHGMVEVRRGSGSEYLVIDPITESTILTGTRSQAMSFAKGDSGHVQQVVR
jgi:hypothetical protein